MALGLTGVPSSVGRSFTGKVTTAGALTRLGLSGVPRGRYTDISKEPAQARSGAQISTLGLGAFSRPVWGDLSKTVVSTTYYDYSTDALTFTENSYSVLQDKVIDYAGVEVVPVTYDYEIIQGGQTISYSVDALTFTEYSYNVEQDDPANTVVRYDPAPLTFTTYDYAVAQQRLVSYSNTPNVSFIEYTYDVIPGVLGEQTITNADILAIKLALGPQFTAINTSISNIQSQVTESLSGVDFGPKGIYVPKRATPKQSAVNQKRPKRRKNKKIALDMLNTAMKLVTKEL